VRLRYLPLIISIAITCTNCKGRRVLTSYNLISICNCKISVRLCLNFSEKNVKKKDMPVRVVEKWQMMLTTSTMLILVELKDQYIIFLSQFFHSPTVLFPHYCAPPYFNPKNVISLSNYII